MKETSLRGYFFYHRHQLLMPRKDRLVLIRLTKQFPLRKNDKPQYFYGTRRNGETWPWKKEKRKAKRSRYCLKKKSTHYRICENSMFLSIEVNLINDYKSVSIIYTVYSAPKLFHCFLKLSVSQSPWLLLHI